ncbi:hypothetical protein GcM3_192030 [Golovinomyces cichoracearum]|uniref:Uncharacterized protein n=1 Tax=Golovinomyces cichoracearum TaxID=62708 RepID=A0A420HHR6_9PEZI|nr:hypothetical protein GcM3_192030 [Golovinomyces cichoracearum]
MFQNISYITDDAANDKHLHSHLQTTFRVSVADLYAVELSYFECHVNNLPKPPRPYQTEANAIIHAINPSNTRKVALAVAATTLPKKLPTPNSLSQSRRQSPLNTSNSNRNSFYNSPNRHRCWPTIRKNIKKMTTDY